jgi:hypothetical protein
LPLPSFRTAPCHTERLPYPFPNLPQRRFLTVPTPFHEVLAELIDRSSLTQTEIAKKLGYPRPNIITMFKQGATKVPLNRIGPLARILDVDAVWLLRRALREYQPELWKVLEGTLGPRVTSNELEILGALRAATDDMDPKLNGTAGKRKIEELAVALTT